MLKIRLQRVGRKHDPSFRVVLTDSKNGPKSGNFLEILGNYDPKKDVKKVDGERVKELISQGAQVSDTVYNILISEKIIEGKKINVLPKKSPVINEESIAEAKEKEEAKAKEEVIEEPSVENVSTEEVLVESKENTTGEEVPVEEASVATEEKKED